MATALRTAATAVVIAAALTQAACSGGSGGASASPSTTADAEAPQTAAAPASSPAPAGAGSTQPAPTGSTGPAAPPSSDATAAASPTATVPPGSTMTLQPAPGLMVQVPADALTAAATTYDDGMHQTYYDSAATAVTVDVEYYSGGSKPAGDMLSAEQEALKSQGVEASAGSAAVEGGSNATRLSWTSSAVPPWSQDPHAAKVQVACAGVIVDGAGGYSYGVYVFASSERADSTALMTAVLDSIAVTAP
ncbi:hypothetical protein OHJ16_01290 [Actinomyces israelii]|uniref:Serine/arginine repetitive matrix protein 1 n=1 Tax=Actinomyces israelii TaxID=1659 RepID=A0ABT4I4Q9_9ACTO|nr:hypothetical protein [Actinomyces israelii]MCZ0856685.1 hypothetical protein [Actinomyces israelii]WKR22600.1 hypothetical protein AIF0345_2551 [Actinomyces israelii]